jgi:hypothetical protein
MRRRHSIITTCIPAFAALLAACGTAGDEGLRSNDSLAPRAGPTVARSPASTILPAKVEKPPFDRETVAKAPSTVLATVNRVDGHIITFQEHLPGMFSVSEAGMMGSRPALSRLDGKSLAEIYRLAAPGEDVPAAILEADARLGRLPGVGSGGAVPATGGRGATGAPALPMGPSLAPALQGTPQVHGAGNASSDPFYQSQGEQSWFTANYCSPALACQTTGYPYVSVGNPSSFSATGYTTWEAPVARTMNVFDLVGGTWTNVYSTTINPGSFVTVWLTNAGMTPRYAEMVDPSAREIASDSYLAVQGSWPIFQFMMIADRCVASNGLHNQFVSDMCLHCFFTGTDTYTCTSVTDLDRLFEWDANTGVIHTGNGHCVDDFAFGLVNNPIDEWECDGKANQVWHQIKNNKFDGWGNTCLAFKNNLLDMEDCNNFGDWNMSTTFTTPAVSSNEPGAILAYWPAGDLGMVLDVQWNSRAPGTPVWIWGQDGSSAQSWAYSPTSQEIYLTDGSNMCLHAQSSNIGAVDIQPCDGDVYEQWYPTIPPTPGDDAHWRGQWVNVASVLYGGQACCLDVDGAGKTAGTFVGTYPCYGGVNQEWHGPQ